MERKAKSVRIEHDEDRQRFERLMQLLDVRAPDIQRFSNYSAYYDPEDDETREILILFTKKPARIGSEGWEFMRENTPIHHYYLGGKALATVALRKSPGEERILNLIEKLNLID